MSNGELIKKLHNHFDSLANITPDEPVEFWFARDLQEPLGYARWENFITIITKAIESCKTTGCAPADHFRSITKMIDTAKGAKRELDYS
jgi:DNA-damage-inducible protein D